MSRPNTQHLQQTLSEVAKKKKSFGLRMVRDVGGGGRKELALFCVCELFIYLQKYTFIYMLPIRYTHQSLVLPIERHRAAKRLLPFQRVGEVFLQFRVLQRKIVNPTLYCLSKGDWWCIRSLLSISSLGGGMCRL